MIDVLLDEHLQKRNKTYYWLAKETGISPTTLWRLKKGHAKGINFDTLANICRALECNPGEVLALTRDKKRSNK